jgi:predicted hydrocarbon binding protein
MISLAAGGNIQIAHAYYADEDYYDRNPAAGIVRSKKTAQRGLHVSEDFITGLQQGLEEEVGDAAGLIMYKAGFEWALEDMKEFEPRFESEFGGCTKMREAHIMLALETWWWPLNSEGWGAWRVDFSQRKNGLIYADVFDSAVAKSLGNIGKPVCYFYAGQLAGVFTYFSKHQLAGIEIQCYSMGEDFCKFLIGSEKRVDAASFWVQEGASAKDIAERLQT